MKTSSPLNEMEKEDIYKLKEIIDKLYGGYRAKRCHLSDIEGLWSILTFCFSKISGLELYLSF